MTKPTKTRAQVLAFLALADAPMPERIAFYGGPDYVDLSFASHGEVQVWMALFEIERTKNSYRTQPYDEGGVAGVLLNVHGQWGDVLVTMSAIDERTESPGLDGETRSLLQLIVDQRPDQPSEPGSSGSGTGSEETAVDGSGVDR